jgi:16S rRNA (cytosine967-C5)-methyltransferase
MQRRHKIKKNNPAEKNAKINLRYIAGTMINDITNGKSLSENLEPAFNELSDSRDRAFVQALCYGVCRFYSRLDVALSLLLKKPMKAKDSDVHALIMVGLYQMMFMRLPEYAAVTETVDAVENLKKPWAKGLTNAVLRQYLRQREEIDAALQVDDEALYAHPNWWLSAIKKDWPEDYQAILKANNEIPPMTLRVNLQHGTRENYLQRLSELDMEAIQIPEVPSALKLIKAQNVEQLPGWLDGDVFIQDAAAQLSAMLLDLQAGQRVLDACAAPGGKLTHILEVQPQLAKVVAVEKNKQRFSSIVDNLQRLQQQADLKCADVNDLSAWWDGQLFDRILLDAPCSASGVIRRHPDIKLLRQPQDIAALAFSQQQLLKTLWQTLAPGGLLLYVTCSLFRQENEAVIQDFMLQHSDAQEFVIKADWGKALKFGRQILPGQHHMDGFYFACLEKMPV